MSDLQQRDNPYNVTQASRIYFLPNLMTAGNLFCGFAAVIKCIQARLITDVGEYAQLHPNQSWMTLYTHAVWLILAAVIFDSLDGRLARMGGRTSLFGAEFDSLADVVSFGMTPALMVFFLILAPREDFQWFRELGWIVAFIYLLCGAVRLARFNVITNPLLHRAEAESSKDFVGLPIPAAAGTVASLVLLLLNMAANARELRQLTLALPLILMLVSFLMVSTIRYPSFKQVNWETRTRIRTLVIFFIGVVLVVRLQEVALFFLFLGYIAYGLFAHYQRGVRHAQMRALRRKVVKMKQEVSE
ncbi:CDP-diacylglycerol--serine O-phosphatidyltransferase [Opitutus sp. GAS368]|jgi:CDP-diacylglycerol--serine O-phosphatidyltransferase|uniref:CDP-diacylglycerol--serine O-phosphatidyltransferase n=1 Tax=Opitutus sp. GAS368 TaxID=1882749 RepID=UPI00087DDA9B|nr:CDP-diacylglycerol--serine O-phosphatidyltransferase [Opitutus sp. GAS368]SDR97081.1 CDP-diacylglycerol---serine O-phosphatidyltransferase [Opitutus sp. GAS368]